MSRGRLDIKVYGAGELVGPFEVFDAVSQGTAEMGHGAAYYWRGKAPIAAIARKMKAKKASVAGVQAIQKPPKSGWVQEKLFSCCATWPQVFWARAAAGGNTIRA